mgnify:CR=1 FL=1
MRAMDVLALIKLAGGTKPLASKLGVDHSTVRGWKRDGVVPAKHIGQIHKEMGVPLTDLLPLIGVAPRRAKPRAEAA